MPRRSLMLRAVLSLLFILALLATSGRAMAGAPTVALGGGIAEKSWYRVTMDFAVSGTDATVTGKVFAHGTPTNPDSPLGGQIGATLSFTGPRPAGVDATGEVGVLASAKNAAIDTSVINISINP